MDDRIKRLRDALNALVIADEHAGACPAVTEAQRDPVQRGACVCGYIERLAIARRALADDHTEVDKQASIASVDPNDVSLAWLHYAVMSAFQSCAGECEAQARAWLDIDREHKGPREDALPTAAQERAIGAQQCARSLHKIIATSEQRINALGSEADLATRWTQLLYAESRLQRQRDEIVEAIETAAVTNLRGGVPDGVPMPVPETTLIVVRDIVRDVEDVLADQVNRPSPDFRALLLRTRVQLSVLRDCIEPVITHVQSDSIRGALKEALRLTDVERLASWPPVTLAGVALRHVLDALDSELLDHEQIGEEPLGLDWIAKTRADLEEARNDPAAYLARKQTS